ncbi:hypothetical protein HMPREF1109_0324 [Streptococcus intermedius SK54 = ATCC 27335]|nr:hypothetical protein HMPREF1109_0324 [Streptococcus intermedius SK54 = ATCC 27335]
MFSENKQRWKKLIPIPVFYLQVKSLINQAIKPLTDKVLFFIIRQINVLYEYA